MIKITIGSPAPFQGTVKEAIANVSNLNDDYTSIYMKLLELGTHEPGESIEKVLRLPDKTKLTCVETPQGKRYSIGLLTVEVSKSDLPEQIAQLVNIMREGATHRFAVTIINSETGYWAGIADEGKAGATETGVFLAKWYPDASEIAHQTNHLLFPNRSDADTMRILQSTMYSKTYKS